MHMSGESLIVILLIGLAAGWLASEFVEGTERGLLGDVTIGVIGAFVGNWLLPRKLAHMANPDRQILRQPSRRPSHPADHLTKLWDPRMRQAITAHLAPAAPTSNPQYGKQSPPCRRSRSAVTASGQVYALDPPQPQTQVSRKRAAVQLPVLLRGRRRVSA